jgi:hypothetical protein
MHCSQFLCRGMLIIALGGFAGCTSQQANLQGAPAAVVASSQAIEGKWLTPTGGSIEFRPSGQAVMAGPNGSYELQYSVPEGKRIELRRPGNHAALQWQIVSVQDKALVVKDADGKNVALRRGN